MLSENSSFDDVEFIITSKIIEIIFFLSRNWISQANNEKITILITKVELIQFNEFFKSIWIKFEILANLFWT